MTSAIAHLRADLPAALADPASPVRLREVPFPAQLELWLGDQDADAAGAAGRFLGRALPAPGHAAGDGEPYVLWLGPGRYLVVDRTGGEPKLLAGLPGAVEVSAARTVLELSGPDASNVLGHDCPLDLHPRAFAAGRCAQTRLAGAQAIVHRTAAETFRLLPRSSQADHLVRRLLASATEYLQAGA